MKTLLKLLSIIIGFLAIISAIALYAEISSCPLNKALDVQVDASPFILIGAIGFVLILACLFPPEKNK